MRKRFVGKKRNEKRIGRKILCFFVLVLFSFFITFHISVKSIKENMTKEEIIDLLFQNGMGNNELLDFLKMNPTEFLFATSMGIRLPKSETVFLESDENGPNYEYIPDQHPSDRGVQ